MNILNAFLLFIIASFSHLNPSHYVTSDTLFRTVDCDIHLESSATNTVKCAVCKSVLDDLKSILSGPDKNAWKTFFAEAPENLRAWRIMQATEDAGSLVSISSRSQISQLSAALENSNDLRLFFNLNQPLARLTLKRRAWQEMQDMPSSIDIIWKNDPIVLGKLADDLSFNNQIGTWLKGNPDKFDTWKGISSNSSTSRHISSVIEALYDFRKPYIGDLIQQSHFAYRHIMHGDLVIQVNKNGQLFKKYFFPASKFLDSSPGSGGLVDKLVEIRTYLSDPTGNYSMRGGATGARRMPGVERMVGFHGKYKNCSNCGFPYDGTLTTSDLKVINLDSHVGAGNIDGIGTVDIVNNPSVKSLSLDGWNYLKTSGSLSPAEVVNNIKNDPARWGYQRKTNNNSTTLYPQNLSESDYEEIIASAMARYPVGSIGNVDVTFKYGSSELTVTVNNQTNGFHSAYITDIQPE